VRSRLVLLLVVSCCLSRAVAQDGTCENFETDSPQCVAPCVGSPLIKNMIVGSEGAGVYHIEYQTFICSSSAKGNTCSSSIQVPIEEVNSLCDGGGGCSVAQKRAQKSAHNPLIVCGDDDDDDDDDDEDDE